jgi:hypothetical protein
MTHDELLDKIDLKMLTAAHTDAWNIVRVIVELHTDVQTKHSNRGKSGLRARCTECGFAYPCPTIQAVEKELK